MPYTPPTYPASLTSKFWNKKKGIIARMKNDVETGIGKAADSAEALFDKIEWKVFDYEKNKPSGSNAGTKKNIEFQIEEMSKYWTSHVKPVIEAVKDLGEKAHNSVDDLKKAKYPDAAKGAGEMADAVKSYTPGLQMNGLFFSGVFKLVKEHQDSLEQGKQKANEIATGDPKKFLFALLKGVKTLADFPLPKENESVENWRKDWSGIWEDQVKNPGRSLNNGFKAADTPKMKQHLSEWTNKFNGFVAGNMNEFRDYQNLEPAELIKRCKKLLVDVLVEAKKLQSDL